MEQPFLFTKPDFTSPSWRMMEFGLSEVEDTTGHFVLYAEHPVLQVRTQLCVCRTEQIARFMLEAVLLMRSTYMLMNLGEPFNANRPEQSNT